MSRRTRRRLLQSSLALTGLGLLSACGLAALPRPEPKRAARLGLLISADGSAQQFAPNLDAFRQGMRAQGYEEGQDYVLESRSAEGREELLPGLAAELVSLPVDVMLGSGLPAIIAARNATAMIPIVMANVGTNPVDFGLVESLARPGGNVTGTANLGVLLTGKRVDLLKQLLPALARLAMFQDVASPGNTGNVAEAEPVARTLGIQLHVLPVRSASDLDAAFEAAIRAHAEALLVFGSTFFQINRTRIIELAAQHHLPAIYGQRDWAEAGGLMAYAANDAASYRNAATFVSKILKGARPADLPVEQPNTFELIVNLKTARALGLTIPQSILQQATETIQ